MSGQGRRLKKLEVANGDTRDSDYWFRQHLMALDGDTEARAAIDAIIAAGGSPGYRGFQKMISDVVDRGRERGRTQGPGLTKTDYAGLGAA